MLICRPLLYPVGGGILLNQHRQECGLRAADVDAANWSAVDSQCRPQVLFQSCDGIENAVRAGHGKWIATSLDVGH